jgi:hypothetical protein
MAAQKVGFTPRLLKKVAVTFPFIAQLHKNPQNQAYIAKLSLKPASYGAHTLGACKNRTIFGLSVRSL